MDHDGEQLGIMAIEEAFAAAEESALDLVEVSPNSDPPVCRIMDFGRYKYQQSKRSHEAKKRQKNIQVKEVKLRPKTEEHDFQFKARHIRRFLGEGNKAKVTIMFRGREMMHQHLGLRLLNRMTEELKDIAQVEQEPTQEGRNMSMVLAPTPHKNS